MKFSSKMDKKNNRDVFVMFEKFEGYFMLKSNIIRMLFKFTVKLKVWPKIVKL